jgi:hypothetical protein
MKYLSIFVLAVFINFTALPSIAVIFDWEIPTLNNNISEEEVKNNLANYNVSGNFSQTPPTKKTTDC